MRYTEFRLCTWRRAEKETSPRIGGLLRVCWLTNRETTPLWYKRTEFIFRSIVTSWGLLSSAGDEETQSHSALGKVSNTAMVQMACISFHLNLILDDPKDSREPALEALSRTLSKCTSLKKLEFAMDTNKDHAESWPIELRELCTRTGYVGSIPITASYRPELRNFKHCKDIWPSVKWQNITGRPLNFSPWLINQSSITGNECRFFTCRDDHRYPMELYKGYLPESCDEPLVWPAKSKLVTNLSLRRE